MIDWVKKYWWLLLVPAVALFIYYYAKKRAEVEKSAARAREGKALKNITDDTSDKGLGE